VVKKLIFIFLIQIIPTFAFGYCKEVSQDVYESSNRMELPLTSISSNWRAHYYVTNVSNEIVDVKMMFTDMEGLVYMPSIATYKKHFSSENTPLDYESGARLLPGETGIVSIDDNNLTHIGVGEIQWSSDSCIYRGLMVRILNDWSTSSVYSQGQFYLNNGQPF